MKLLKTTICLTLLTLCLSCNKADKKAVKNYGEWVNTANSYLAEINKVFAGSDTQPMKIGIEDIDHKFYFPNDCYTTINFSFNLNETNSWYIVSTFYVEAENTIPTDVELEFFVFLVNSMTNMNITNEDLQSFIEADDFYSSFDKEQDPSVISHKFTYLSSENDDKVALYYKTFVNYDGKLRSTFELEGNISNEVDSKRSLEILYETNQKWKIEQVPMYLVEFESRNIVNDVILIHLIFNDMFVSVYSGDQENKKNVSTYMLMVKNQLTDINDSYRYLDYDLYCQMLDVFANDGLKKRDIIDFIIDDSEKYVQEPSIYTIEYEVIKISNKTNDINQDYSLYYTLDSNGIEVFRITGILK